MISALALLLAAAAPEVPPDCAPADHACKAERFSRLAAQTDDPALRAQRLYVAHRSYLSLHKETGDPRALCRARELLDRGRAIDPLPPPLVEPLRKSETELRAREVATPADCTPRRLPERAARKPTEPTSVPPTTPPPPSDKTPLALLEDSPPSPAGDELLPIRASAPQPLTVTGPTTPTTQPPRTSRARIAGGISLLLASVGFGAGTAVSLHQRGAVVRDFQRLDAMLDATDRPGTPAEYALADDLNRRYGRLTLAAGLTGAATTAGLLAGVIVLATPPRRARVLALPGTGSRLAGLVLRGHF